MNAPPNKTLNLAIGPLVPDQTNARLDALEARARDTDRQLRTLRGNRSELPADIAARLEQLVDRLDGTDRRVAALKQGLNDTMDVVGKHEDRVENIDRTYDRIVEAHAIQLNGDNRGRIGLIERIRTVQDRVTITEMSIARIEDMLTSESMQKAKAFFTEPKILFEIKCNCVKCQGLK